jgi:hypothetical protein
MRSWLETLAKRAGLPAGLSDLMREEWQGVTDKDGDRLELRVGHDGNGQWWAGLDAPRYQSPTFYAESPEAAFSWLAEQVGKYEHIPCPRCRDEGTVSWAHGEDSGEEFCDECDKGNALADAAEQDRIDWLRAKEMHDDRWLKARREDRLL